MKQVTRAGLGMFIGMCPRLHSINIGYGDDGEYESVYQQRGALAALRLLPSLRSLVMFGSVERWTGQQKAQSFAVLQDVSLLTQLTSLTLNFDGFSDGFLSGDGEGGARLDSLVASLAALAGLRDLDLELVERDAKPGKGFQSAEDKAANKPAPQIMKAFLIWKETRSGNLVLMTERIDKLYWGNADGTMKSGVLQFLEDIGMPVPKDQIPSWGSVFILTMKIRARVVRRIRNDLIVPDEYVFKAGSFRKYQV